MHQSISGQIRREYDHAHLRLRADLFSGLHKGIKAVCSPALSECPPDHHVIAIARYGREAGPLNCAEKLLICTPVSTLPVPLVSLKDS